MLEESTGQPPRWHPPRLSAASRARRPARWAASSAVARLECRPVVASPRAPGAREARDGRRAEKRVRGDAFVGARPPASAAAAPARGVAPPAARWSGGAV